MQHWTSHSSCAVDSVCTSRRALLHLNRSDFPRVLIWGKMKKDEGSVFTVREGGGTSGPPFSARCRGTQRCKQLGQSRSDIFRLFWLFGPKYALKVTEVLPVKSLQVWVETSMRLTGLQYNTLESGLPRNQTPESSDWQSHLLYVSVQYWSAPGLSAHPLLFTPDTMTALPDARRAVLWSLRTTPPSSAAI